MSLMQLAVANLLTTTRPPVADSHKHCKRCGEDRLKEEFRVKSNGHLNHICIPCLSKKTSSAAPQKCHTCGTEFVQKKYASNQRFCSHKCHQKDVRKAISAERKAKQKPRNCMVCGAVFMSNQPRQVNCSEKCSNRHGKILARERARKAVEAELDAYHAKVKERIEARAC